jgi:hypothetical protein
MITTYKKEVKGQYNVFETKSVEKLKDNYKNVIRQMEERATKAGYELQVKLMYDGSMADRRYAYQARGWEFLFDFYKDGQCYGYVFFSLNAPAFKRGSLSGKPIRINVPIPSDDIPMCRYEYI